MFEFIKNKIKDKDMTIISYLIFGVLTTVVDWAVYSLLRLTGLNYFFSNTIAWEAAVCFSFITNKTMVFNSKSFDRFILIKEFISFTGARLFSFALQIVGIKFMIDYANINEYIAKAVMSVVVIVCNYVLSKILVFKTDVVK